MALSPGEADRLLLYTQGLLARERRERGLLLNVPESTALIANAVCEAARDGQDLAMARETGRSVLTVDDILPGVLEVVAEVSVEARFDDGTRLVVVRDPFKAGAEQALGDMFVSVPSTEVIRIENCALTPIGLTSHIHLAEVNPRLLLDRRLAYGNRLALPSGDTILIAPGETVELPMRPIGGARVVIGNTGVVDGSLDDVATRDRALATLRSCGYLDSGHHDAQAPSPDHAVSALMRMRESTR